MIDAAELKPFISHPDSRVRLEVIKYFHDGHIVDPEILQLSIQACKKYGWENCLPLIYENKHQYIDDATAGELVQAYQQSSSDIVQMHLISLLNRANLDYLEKNFDVLKKTFPAESLNVAQYRLKYNSWPAEKLWDELKAFAYENRNVEYYNNIDQHRVDAIIEMLGRFNWPDEKIIYSIFNEAMLADEDSWDQNWLFWALLVDLAGVRKLKSCLDFLNEFLSMDGDLYLESAQKALSRIGTDAVVDMIRRNFIQKNWDYQLYGCGILENIKTKYSEAAIIELLEQKDSYEVDIYANLCFALCDLFSEKAFEWGRTIIDDMTALEFDNIKERLIILAQVLGVELPEADKWKSQIASDRAKLADMRRQRFLGGERLSNLLAQNRFEKGYNLAERDIMSGRFPGDEDFDPQKVGRNDLCPCGSGKKYKKCCLDKNN